MIPEKTVETGTGKEKQKMEMWFSELHTSNVKLSMRIEKQLFSGNSDCQRIDVLESVEFGKFLALDGDILFSEKDEFIYDEMVTHVPMAVHPDVFGPSEGLFTREFYGSCYKALKEDGIMVYQHGSPFYDEDKEECMKMHRKAFRAFPVSRVYQAHIPTCSSGYWLFGFASKKYHPLNNLRVKEWKKLHIKTRYYTTNLHRGAFMLPKYLEDMLEDEEDR